MRYKTNRITIIEEMDIKKLIESIIEDLVNDVPISKILLKAQTIAYTLNNEEFKKWIEQEQNGYPNKKSIPDYRVIPCSIKVDIALPFQRIYRNYLIPSDFIQDKQDRDFLCVARITESISSLENMITDLDSQKTLAIVELKDDEFKHADLSQLNAYVSYYREN